MIMLLECRTTEVPNLNGVVYYQYCDAQLKKVEEQMLGLSDSMFVLNQVEEWSHDHIQPVDPGRHVEILSRVSAQTIRLGERFSIEEE